jgi:ATP-dependent helicase Lhr and Lhr-like helicase
VSGEAAERLHPALVHHLIGTLRWTQLRPLQEQAIDPLLSGAHALLGAPTAAGKTEAAMLPLLSRMASEQWSGLSVLYLCPLRALLNNLAPRIEGLCALLGRRAALWHGDVGDSARRRILADPPDVLLTTPESVEAMFLSRQVDAVMLLGGVRAVVVDEIHAFAGDDRGWHMLALLCRVDALRRAGTEDGGEVTTAAQRVGLTATVGNPEALLDWLCVGAPGERAVVMATDEGLAPPELEVDWVGSLDNAAEVITRLHRGEKRLVFADSRARVEELGAALRARKVTTFVSHSSLSADDRRQAERAFTESRDCVIVATSTLELGIDVGDLDRVIQLGAPRTVASVLQRVGRTGRRGAVRNCLFLATSDIELLTALALVDLLRQGWVEPLRPPAYPVALAAQQLLTRVLADGRLGRSEWPGSFGPVAEAARLDYAVLQGVLRHMVERGILLEEGGVLQIGVEGERLFGRRHFIDLASMFLSEPLYGVRWGQRMLGHIDPSSLTSRGAATPTILLGGTSWGVRNIDWEQRVAWVEPSDEPGRSRWSGAGGTLSLEVCQAIRGVLAGDKNPGWCSRRAVRQVVKLREEYWFTRDGITSAEQLPDRTRTRWWTWAGGRANSELAWRLASEGSQIVSADDLSVTLAGLAEGSELRKKAAAARKPGPQIEPHRLRAIKFNASVPVDALETMCRIRDGDAEAIRQVLDEPAESANRQSR